MLYQYGSVSADASFLDEWSSDQFQSLLNRSNEDPKLKELLPQDNRVISLHLLGCDSNGHAHRPFASIYLNNVKVVDHIAKRMYSLLEGYFKDNRTVHGDGQPANIDTPLVVWGAGVNYPKPLSGTNHSDCGFRFVNEYPHDTPTPKEWGLDGIERVDVSQADIASIMVSLSNEEEFLFGKAPAPPLVKKPTATPPTPVSPPNAKPPPLVKLPKTTPTPVSPPQYTPAPPINPAKATPPPPVSPPTSTPPPPPKSTPSPPVSPPKATPPSLVSPPKTTPPPPVSPPKTTPPPPVSPPKTTLPTIASHYVERGVNYIPGRICVLELVLHAVTGANVFHQELMATESFEARATLI
ncbi:hypothetical protein Patl1_21953 [Pistacia atlantica]|uniref:Uncharacterized protein n=1 Tax=Pistacia atlantica TaxID=434234 RepID=A0ACC1BJK1_9ROSI|nr:hypothetical protein Patl1_21953 [Pistacia atlantica]